MDVLKPQLLWVGKRCYRVNSVANDDNLQQPETNEYIEDGLCTIFYTRKRIYFLRKSGKENLFKKNETFSLEPTELETFPSFNKKY